MSIIQFLEQAELGALDTCRECPWSPKRNTSIGFGVSCIEHGLDWTKESLANSMLIAQDPGDTTPHTTGRLCTVHNSKNQTDKTAQQNLELWKTAVSLNAENPEASGYLKKHYWLNSIMHGASASTGLRDKAIMETARKHCSKVLEAQIRMLRPKVVIATGLQPTNSLYDIGLISRNWSDLRHNFSSGAYMEKNSSWFDDKSISVYSTYHTSARVVNQTLSRSYNFDIEKSIKNKIVAHKLETQDSIIGFLSKYHDMSNATHRGMRYLLNHWLDIGVGIRTAYNEAT